MIKKLIEEILGFLIPGEIKENSYLLFDVPTPRYKYYINYIRALLMTPYYRLLMKIFRPRNITRKKYYVSICAIFKDEGCYLREWLEFHKIIGIEHFYLYNNFSSDNYLEVLEPYIQAGEVTLTDWPVPRGQMSAYQDCFNRFRNETNWLTFVDIDEFIIPNKMDTVQEFLKPFETKRPVLLMYWRMFGTSGIIERDINGLVIEDFKVCYQKYVNIGKLFFNTAYDLNFNKNTIMHHYTTGEYKGISLPPVNCFDEIVLYGIHKVPNDDLPIQMNHYLIKSYKEFFDKKTKRGTVCHVIHNTKYFTGADKRCQSIDLHAYKYMIPLKLIMSDKSVLIHNRGGVKLLSIFAFTKNNELKLAA